ncbi:MAG: OmpA family protein, partial [Clostridia bacterium]|nr:OmpA family protein [Clostridia bacterium]
LGGYETHEIEDVDVAPVGDISVNLGGYETHEIEDVDVAPVDDIGVNLGEYETHEIEDVDVAPLEPIRVDLGEYPTREIEALEVKPLEEIQVELAEYDVPDISGIAPVELQPFYLGLVGYLGDAQRQALSGLSEIEVANLVQRQHDLIDDINAAFLDAGITASVDPISGSVPINATLLYATDAYEVTDAGKQVLASVFRVYCDVLSREAYRDFISNVVIVGHTDTDGSYDYNVTLSQKRAEAVKAFCLSPECGVGDPDWLSSRLIAEGHSYDELIYNSDGTENKAASRRVEIGFNIAIG